MYGTDMDEFMVGLIIGIVVLYLVVIGLGLVSYILSSIGLHKLGNRRMIPNAWMAWIPVANSYLLGKIVDEYDGRNGIKRKWSTLLLIFDIIAIVTFVISYIAMFTWLISFVIQAESMGANVPDEEILGMLGGVVVFYVLMIVVAVIATAQSFCKSVCIYKVFESTVPNKSVLYFLLYLLVPLAGSICLFSCRNKGYSNEIVAQPTVTPVVPVQVSTVSEETVQPNEVSETTDEL